MWYKIIVRNGALNAPKLEDHMADIINLRRARKAKDRATAGKEADANRLKHGQTKAVKAARVLETAREGKAFSQHKLDEPDSEPPG